MLRRVLFLVVASTLMVLSPAAALGSSPQLAVTATTLGDGFHRVTGTDCAPTTEVTAVVSEVDRAAAADLEAERSHVAHTMSDAQGQFDTTVFVGDDPGDYVVAVSCGDVAQSVSIRIGAEPTSAAPPSDRADDARLPLARLGLVLGATAIVAYVADRRRRTSVSRS